jgi:hypothetical protein
MSFVSCISLKMRGTFATATRTGLSCAMAGGARPTTNVASASAKAAGVAIRCSNPFICDVLSE